MIDEDTLIEWSSDKNEILKSIRKISFEDVETVMRNSDVIAFENHSSKKYPHQFVAVIYVHEYCYMVPFVVDKEKDSIFLKTIIPSRKYKKKYAHLIQKD